MDELLSINFLLISILFLVYPCAPEFEHADSEEISVSLFGVKLSWDDDDRVAMD